MKVVYFTSNTKVLPIKSGIVLALGYFDGLHLAHQNLIQTAIKVAKEKKCRSGVMTFNPSPKQYLGKHASDNVLTPHNAKIDALDKMGVDYLFVIKFDRDVAKLEHKEFIKQFVIPLSVLHIVTGFDYQYGYKGQGNVDTLVTDGNNTYSVTSISEMKVNGEKISSSRIRELILKGDVHSVKEYLGRHYTTEGIVVHGFKRGREIGFPTANISTIDNYLVPQNGVYIVRVKVFQKEYIGICNIGYNPTFSENSNKSVEVHILNFNKYIYNEKISITWIKKIRDEMKFESVNDLINQLNSDKIKAMEFLNNT